MKAQCRVSMIDSDHRRFQKPGVSRSGEVVEHSNSMQPDTGVGKLDNRENISSAIIVSLNNNDITLRSLCNVLRDVPSPGRWWKLLSDAAPRISNRAVLLSQEKRAMESTTMTNTTTRGSCYLQRVRNGTDGGSNYKRSRTSR